MRPIAIRQSTYMVRCENEASYPASEIARGHGMRDTWRRTTVERCFRRIDFDQAPNGGYFPSDGARRSTKTIGHARAGGETKLTIHCLGCYHQAIKTFEELKLWNDLIFVDVPRHRRLVCTQCGSRNVRVMPVFPPARGTPGY